MTIGLNVSLDRTNLRRFRLLMQANKTIAAKSLTFTAERAQTAWRAGHGVFHRRNTWIDKGVRIRHATASSLNAQVGTIDRYMGRHVKGVDQPKTSGRKALFVPIEPAASQPTHTRIRARIRAMQRTKTKPFKVRDMLLRRAGRGHDAPLKALAVLRKRVEIKPRLDAVTIVDRAVQSSFPSVYERLLIRWANGG